VASHVFEHLTDPVHFLQRCERALSDTGRLYLLIPDRRYTFDYFRPVSTTGQVLQAFVDGRRRHGVGALYDQAAYSATRSGAAVWGPGWQGPFGIAGVAHAGYENALGADPSVYRDCHAWVFTASSFRLIMQELRELGLVALGETFFHDCIGCEFLMVLQRGARGSGQDRLALAQQAMRENIEHDGGASGQAAYELRSPHPQNALDLMRGSWVGSLPPALGLSAGTRSDLWDDARIRWLADTLGGLQGRDVLELGPLEAAHTAALLQAGARSVLAIEANRQAFLKCLIVKELCGLRDASFLLGDFMGFFANDARRWPLIVASGVLYHMADPLQLLQALAERTDTLFLWTHVIDDAAMPQGDTRRDLVAGVENVAWRGRALRYHRRVPYGPGQQDDPIFCGGLVHAPAWMERDALLQVLGMLGFNDLRIAHEQPDHPAGPALSILARRRVAAQTTG
jgi:SAM-dependent methyltransferase